MALLSPLLSLSPAPPITSIAISSSTSLPIRLQTVSVSLHPTFRHSSQQVHAPVIAQRRGNVVAMVSAAVEPAEEGEDKSENGENNIPVENLPLESKLQLKLDQKIKMNIAKKARLKRSRLMRKRKMRKKGRWPPSKMKKLQNV
ncbi:50S ribosomal protein 5 alpha chloroplastic [Bienertia sinuspersici]